MMRRVRAIIFDLDGLMINTEELAFQVYQQILEPYGQHLEDRHFQEFIGMDADDTVRYILDATQLSIDGQALGRAHLESLLARMRTDLEPNPGLIPLLDELLRRKYPLAIASNSTTGYVYDALAALRLQDHFRAIVGRDQVRQGKPAPEVYLAAAARLNTPVSDCLAIEDSPVGMQAAIEAGIRCVIVNAGWQAAEFSGAFARFPTLVDLHASLDFLLAPSD